MDNFFICKKRGCANPRATKKYCRECADKDNLKATLKRNLKKSSGICTHCDKKAIGKSSLCVDHYIKRVAKTTACNENLANELYEKYLYQNKKCYYSGINIELGVNASLDHIYPQSKFPEYKSSIWNLVWTTKELNIMKNDLNLDDFLYYCNIISKNSDYIRSLQYAKIS